MENNNNDHTAWIAGNFRFNQKTSAFAQVVYTASSSSFSDLLLDPTGLPGTPNGFDYVSISELQDYSSLNIRWVQFQLGLQHLLANRMQLEYGLNYDDYNDDEAFLVNTTGNNIGMIIRLNWLF